MAIKFSVNARDKMTTINNNLANLAIYGYKEKISLPEEAVLTRGSCFYIRSARCSRVVLSKLLAVCSQSKFFISARARKKIAVLACSRMLAKTIRHPSLYFDLNI